MDLDAARRLARELMDQHRLTPQWSFRFDGARRRAGACNFATQTISLSSVLVPLYDQQTVRDTLLHEIAHALAGPAHHHDHVWKWYARTLGAPDNARLPGTLPAPSEPWVGTCPRCGAQRRLYRAPRRVDACGRCCAGTFAPEFILRWSLDGVPTTPGGAYARELADIRRQATQRSASAGRMRTAR